jgi:hypothetical protein
MRKISPVTHDVISVLFLCVVTASCTGNDASAGFLNRTIAAKYRYDMDIDVKGTKKNGVTVLDMDKGFDLSLSWKYSAELIKIMSCHREIVVESNKIFKGKKGYRWVYYPNAVESSGYCPLHIGAYDLHGQHSWGYISFRADPVLERLLAKVVCSGETEEIRGVSVCQSRAGLIQKIEFKERVVYDTPKGCLPPIEVAPNAYEVQASPGICIYTFTGVSKGVHRFELLGYSQVLYREFKADNQDSEGGFGF